MTVAAAGSHEGVLREVVREEALDTDAPHIVLAERRGIINADLTMGVDVGAVAALRANEGICCPGVKLHGDGFIVSRAEAQHLGLGRRPGLEAHIRDYRNGRDLTARPRGVMVIDLFGLDDRTVRLQYPEIYQRLLETVRAQRIETLSKSRTADSRQYAEKWWLFGKPRPELREALSGLPRYIATVETTKHRVFQFLDIGILPDNMIVAIASADAFHLGVLSSRIHTTWAPVAGGWLGMGNDPRYSKSRCFDPFPFPDPVDDALKDRIRAAAEELDATRKDVLERHPDLTLTGVYNVLERLRAIDGRAGGPEIPPLTDKEQDVVDRGLVLILRELHDTIDRLVFAAYGWPADLSDQAILERLVALNRARAEEEAWRSVRWLRPDYQIPRFGSAIDRERQLETPLDGVAEGQARPDAREKFPAGEVARTAAVFAAVAAAPGPIEAAAIAASFRQGRQIEPQVKATLAALVRMGRLTSPDGGRSFAFPRVA